MLLVSLYLPWRRATGTVDGYFGPQDGTVLELLKLFSGSETSDGLSSEVGRPAALFALLLAGLAAAAWTRPGLARRLPLGTAALLAGYFALAVAALTRWETQRPGFEVQYAYGAYVGLGAAVVVLVAGAATRRAELARYLSGSRLAMLVLAGALLGVLLLPWWHFSLEGTQYAVIGIASPAAAVAAVLILCLPAIWSRAGTAGAERLGLAIAIALFTGAAAAGSPDLIGAREYGLWAALGIAATLVALALIGGPRALRLGEASWHQLATGAAAALFLGALFLPWQRWCYGAGFGPISGHCFSTDAWTSTPTAAAAAGVLAIALLVAVFRPRRLFPSTVDFAGGLGLLVATIGFGLQEGGSDGFRVERAYGSTIGFALAGAVIVLALVRLRVPTIERRRLLVRLAPIAACAGYLAIVVRPWWDVLAGDPFEQSILRFAPFSWLTIAGAVVGIRLLGLWARQIGGAAASAELVVLPFALLALAAVDLVAQREGGVTWGGGAVAGLCLLLAAFGRIEQRGGLESLRIPEILRVDRL